MMADTESQDPSPKPCPFCGSTMIFERIAWAKCLSCEATGPVRTPEGSAIQLWNKRSETRWQSIETAPKDGTPVLVCLPDENPYFVWWHDPTKQWVRTRITDPLKSPTHWLPLPAPPSKEAA